MYFLWTELFEIEPLISIKMDLALSKLQWFVYAIKLKQIKPNLQI